jgi:hypothetical protein
MGRGCPDVELEVGGSRMAITPPSMAQENSRDQDEAVVEQEPETCS